ncbi:MAG: glycosyltransferase family 39 protein [Chloroflexota bacterium]
MFTAEKSKQHTSLLEQQPRWLTLSLFVLFLLATLIRLDEIRAPGHLLDREYTSAIFARAYYFTNNDNVETWRRDIAVTAKDQQPVLEPPVLEYLVSLIYRVMGREDISFSRYLTSAFWLIGGVFMFLIAGELLSSAEAVVATAYYLFVPMGIIISRSFQPDSLMMMLFLISLYALVLYFEGSSTKWLITAGIFTGITLLLRPLVIFAIFCAFLALSMHPNKNWKKIIDRPLIVFSVLSLLPSMLYYGYGILFAGFMRWKVVTSFMPFLLTKKDFWLGWFDVAVDVAKFTPLLLAIIGFFLLRNNKVQYLVLGLAVGFVLFTLAFTYHIHTHPYYHIQLFPIVGLCLGAITVSLAKSVVQSSGRIWWLPMAATILLASYFGYREVRDSRYQSHLEDPAVAWEIGELIHHSPRTVYVAYYYGLPLEYYGEFGGAPWPVGIEDDFYRRPGEKELSVTQRIDALGFAPEYFVVTQFSLYNRKHQDLKAYLEENCVPLMQKEQYLIYSSCKMTSGK